MPASSRFALLQRCKISFQFQFHESSAGGNSCYHCSVIFFPLPLGSFPEGGNCVLTPQLQAWWWQRLGQRLVLHAFILGQENRILGCANSEGQSVFISSEFCLDFTFFPPLASDHVLSNDPRCYVFLFLMVLLGKHCKYWGCPECDERKSEVSSPRRALLLLLWP